MIIYGFGMPFAALTLCRLFRNGNADSRERVALLVDSYSSRFWATEVYILAYKFVLTGFIPSASWSEPRIQIWLGVIGNLIASLWLLQSKPFRSKLCNVAALTALLQLLVTYVSAFLFLDNSAATESRVDLDGFAGTILITINCACFVVMAGGSSHDIWRERQLTKARRLRYCADNAVVDLPSIGSNEFHLFLSHTWAQGEEAMRTIKLRLADMIPDAKIFLDKDDLKQGAGAEYIIRSRTILVFCTAKYFKSRACARELILSVLLGKPLIAVIEPDTFRGGLSRADIEDLLLNRGGKLEESEGQVWVLKWGLDEEMRRFGYETMPTGKQVVDALFAKSSIEWNRFSAFQDVSMRLIAERLLPDAVPGSVYVQGEAGSQVLSAPSLTHGRKHHLYCSMHNIGAAQVVADLSKLLSEKRRRISRLPWRAQLLHVTENFAELNGCELMLLYLTRDTWTSGEVSAWLAREVCEAMRLGVPLLLVHESPSALDTCEYNALDRRACDFNDFWLEGWTPKHLLTGDANIYKKIAIAIKPGDWKAAGLACVIRAMRDSSGGERQPVHVDEPDPIVTAPRSSSALRRWSSLRMLHRLPQSKVAGATASIEGHGCSAGELQSRVMSPATKIKTSARQLAPSSGKPLPRSGEARWLSQRLSMRLSRQRSHLDRDPAHERSAAGRVTTSSSRRVGRELPPSEGSGESVGSEARAMVAV